MPGRWLSFLQSLGKYYGPEFDGFKVKGGPGLSLASPFLPPRGLDSALKQHKTSRVTSRLLALSSAPAVLQELPDRTVAKPGVVSGFIPFPSSK